MTIEALLDMSTDDIAKLSDEQLVQYLQPFFPLTRPNKVPAAGSAISTSNFAPEIQAELDRINAAKPAGINIKALLKTL